MTGRKPFLDALVAALVANDVLVGIAKTDGRERSSIFSASTRPAATSRPGFRPCAGASTT